MKNRQVNDFQIKIVVKIKELVIKSAEQSMLKSDPFFKDGMDTYGLAESVWEKAVVLLPLGADVVK